MKVIVFVLLVVAFATVVSAASVENHYITVLLANQNPDPVEPGKSVDVRFRFENNGTGTTDGIEVELIPKYPFSISEPAVKDIGSLDAKQKGVDAIVIKYTVQVDEGVDEGEYGIFIRYRIGTGPWMIEGPYNINVQAAEALLGVYDVKVPQSFSAGSIDEVDVTLKNFGKLMVKDVRVSIDFGNIPLAPIGSSSEQVIDSIPAGKEAVASFKIIADADAAAAYYKTRVTLNYFDYLGNSYVRNSTIGLLVYNEPDFELALKEAKVFTPNSNGAVVLSISNTGPSDIRFMSAELIETKDYRVLSSSTPKVYVGNLEADDFETADFDVRIGDVKPGNIDLKVQLTYKDNLNKEITAIKIVKLPIYSKSDATKFGLVAAGSSNLVVSYFSMGMQIIIFAFLIFMLVDCWKNKLPKYKKALWTVMILTGMGAILYYFLARRKK